MEKEKKSRNLVFKIFQIIIIVFVIGAFSLGIYILYHLFDDENVEYKDISEYKQLDINELEKDYLENEITANDKYKDNFYCFSGTITDIEENLLDYEITMHYHYKYDDSKQMETYGHFSKKYDKIKDLKNGDEITIYCKFDSRNIDNYLGVTSGYRFNSCQIF